MGLRTASVRRLSSETMAPALTETKTSDSFKLTPKTTHTACDQATTVDAAFAAAAAFDDSIAAATTAQTALIRKGVLKGDGAFDLAHFQLAAELLKNDITFDRCRPASTDNDIMNNTESGTINANMGLQQQPRDSQLPPHLQLKDEKIAEGQSVDQILFGGNLPPLHSDDDLMQQVIKSMVASDGGEEELPLTAGDLATLPGNLSSLEKALFNAVDMINIGMVEEQLMDSSTSTTAEDNKDVRTKELITQVRGKQARLERKLDFLVRRLRKMQMRYMGQHVGAEVAGVYEHAHRTLRRLKEQGTATAHAAAGDTNASAALDLSVTASLISAPAHADTTGETVAAAAAESLKPISHSAAKSLVKKLENTRYLQANSSARQRHSARFFGSGSIEPTSFRTASATATPSSSSVTMTTLPTWPAADKASLQQTAGQLRTQLALVQGQLDSDATLSSSGGESCDEMQTYGNVHQQYLAIQKRAAWRYSSDRASIAARWSWLLAQIADLEYRIRQHTDLHRLMRTRKGPVILHAGNSCAAKCVSTTNNAAVNGYRGVLPGDNKATASLEMPTICDNPSTNQTTPDQHTATAAPPINCARIRPLNASAFAKRRLVQTGGLHAVSKKAARPATVRCACIGDMDRGGGGTRAASGNFWRGPMNCAVCTGRGDPTHPRDPTEHLSRMERIALLDGGYHPVVSLPEDTSISIHMEAIMKSVEWQQRSSRSSLKAMKYAIKADRMNCDRDKQQQQPGGASGGEQRAGSGKKGSEHRKKYNRMGSGGGGSIKGSTVNALTAKLKSGRPRGRKPNRHNNNNNNLSHNKKHRRHSHHHHQQQQQRTKEHSTTTYQSHYNSNDDIDDDDDYNNLLDDPDYRPIIGDQYVVGMMGGGGGGSSRCVSPLLATQSISGFGRRNRVDSYDIDNIVIPYSVAASTRVERLQYKEILTPKWRMVDNSNLPPIKYENKNNGVVKITSQESEVSDVEDISEDAVQLRHDKSEQEEKRKFLSYLKLPLGYYGNTAPSARRHHNHHSLPPHHKRTDSRAESSGANTPDNPMSPAAATATAAAVQQGEAAAASAGAALVGDTPVASPPTMDLGNNKADDLPESLRNLPLSSLSSLRRRTISASSSRWLQRDSTSNDGTGSDQQQQPPIVEIPPHDRRQFPLSEEHFDKMLRGMPDCHHKGNANRPMMNVRNQDNNQDIASGSSSLTTASVNVNPAAEQHRSRRSNQQHVDVERGARAADDIDSESTESAFGDEDPNDPEWDVDDQITCGSGRNSHHAELGRFRR